MTQNNHRKHDIRLIALDVDGTILDSKHALTARIEEALKAALAKGVQVILATGKTRHSTLQLIETLGLTSPGIFLQGLVVYDADGDVMHQETLEPALARQVITFAEDRGFSVFAYSGEHILSRTYSKEFEDGMRAYHEIAPEVVGALQNRVGLQPIHKLIAVGDPRAVTALRWQLSNQIGGAGRLIQAGVPTMVELLPPGCSKGTALKQLLKDLKIAPENVMAVGDAENDIEMIQLAGVGVAMGQAAQAIKDIADYVTGTCDEDGVAQAVERFVLSPAETETAESKAEADAPEVVIEPVEPQEAVDKGVEIVKNILVTGGAGFIGSAFVRYMIKRYPEYNIVTYDKLTYAGNMENLAPVSDEPNYAFARGDIADRAVVGQALQAHNIDTIVNFAAESHVDRSILDADAFMHTNSIGVYILLDEGRKHGIDRFLQVSTDEVYGSVPLGESVESDPLAPRNPYSAAKAGGELMARAYYETYGMNVVITRGSNTFGPYQYPEKLLPFFITEALEDHPLPLYGDGRQQRDWLFVEDHVTGIDTVLHQGVAGEAYNVAGEDLRYNIDVTHRLLSALGKPETLIKHVPDREGHDLRYAMNCDKTRALGWNKAFTFDTAVEATVRWYVDNAFWWRQIKTGAYLEYYKRQYAARLAAAES